MSLKDVKDRLRDALAAVEGEGATDQAENIACIHVYTPNGENKLKYASGVRDGDTITFRRTKSGGMELDHRAAEA